MKKNLIITAGGSGGHVVPASVLAKALRNDYKILFFTDKRGLRYKNMIPKNAKVISIPCSALGGKGKLGKLFALAWTAIGVLKTFLLFLYYKPIGVVCFAGYASFPSAVVAGILKKPLILHEQNTILGKTNRILTRWAKAIATSFPETQKIPKNKRTVYTGLPLRESILKLKNTYPSMTKQINILITGGSQGANFLNTITDVLCSLPKNIRQKLRITQQVVGNKEQKHIKNLYKQAGILANITPFIKDMPEQIQQCHLFIGSAGSMILEVQMLRRPMILIPLRISAEGHQITNAKAIEKIGGAKMILEKDFKPTQFKKLILDLLTSPAKLKEMHKSLKPHNGTLALVKLVKEII